MIIFYNSLQLYYKIIFTVIIVYNDLFFVFRFGLKTSYPSVFEVYLFFIEGMFEF